MVFTHTKFSTRCVSRGYNSTSSSRESQSDLEQLLSATAEAGRLCSPRTCATLGTIRGGTASAVGSSEARRFWRAAAYRQFVQEKGLWCTKWGKDSSSYRRRACGVQSGGKDSSLYRRRPSGVQSGGKTAVRTGEGPVVYRVGERQKFVQEKGFWCTEWGKDRSSYRRRACGVQSGGKTAVCTGEGLLVYK